LLILCFGVLLVTPLLPPYLAADRDVWKPSPDLIVSLLPKPADWVRASPTSAGWNWTRAAVGEEFNPAAPPFHLFPGGFAAVGLLVGVGALFVRRNFHARTAAALALAALLVAAFTLHAGWWCPYRAAIALPIVNGVRAVFRVGLVLAFPLCAVAGLAVGKLVEAVRNPVAHKLLVAAVLSLLAYDIRTTDPASRRSGVSRTPLAEAVARREKLADAVRPFCAKDSMLYVFPDGDDLMPALVTQLDAMAAAQMLDIATINCWTGHVPSGWEPFRDHSTLATWLKSRGRDADDVTGRVLFFGAPKADTSSREEFARRARVVTRPAP
jgi:hypothetical protein